MKLFLREHLGMIFLYTFNFIGLFIIYVFFNGFNSVVNTVYFMVISVFLLVCYLSIMYLKNRKIYIALNSKPRDFDKIIGSFGKSEFGESLNKYIGQLYSLHQYKIHLYAKKQNEHLNFINQWVHQMKTPISVIKLILQENEERDYIVELKQEVDKLERGLNIALYNARLETFEYDFNVTNFNLEKLVNEVINSFKRYFIKSKVYPKVNINKALIINSDRKWIKFIVEQLVINAVKYSKKEGSKVYINSYIKDEFMILEIKDEGVGIPKKDLKRVIEPFYTGENGRRYGESTGMGLYLVNEVCGKLNHDITIESKENIGTKVSVAFKSFTDF